LLVEKNSKNHDRTKGRLFTGDEIYKTILEYSDVNEKHELSNVQFISIDSIYKLAYDFECCPYCGRTDIESHFCPHCKERISTPYDGGWFAEYIKKTFASSEGRKT